MFQALVGPSALLLLLSPKVSLRLLVIKLKFWQSGIGASFRLGSHIPASSPLHQHKFGHLATPVNFCV